MSFNESETTNCQCLILIIKIMKKFFLIPFVIASLFIMSCEEEDHHDECHECHIAYMATGSKTQGEIGEFCGDDLADVEANGYTLLEDLVVGDVTIPAGFYPGVDIHCEDHADHDHDH
jgi:hypothetical protein